MQAGTVGALQLVVRAPHVSSPIGSPHTALSFTHSQVVSTTPSKLLPLSVSALVANPASNSSNSSAALLIPSPVALLSRSAHNPNNDDKTKPPARARQKRRERALLAATSLFLLSRDTLKQPWLRAVDVDAIGRNLAPAKSTDPLHAKLEFDHRKKCTQWLVHLARASATGRKLLAQLQTIARRAEDDDGKYLRPNQDDIKHERRGDKTALQDKLLTTKGRRMVNAIHAQFMRDPLPDSLFLALRTSDHLLTQWYRESIRHLKTPHERPDPAFLQKARRNMMVNLLITYGLSILRMDVNVPQAARALDVVTSAAIRKLNTSERFAALLRRSELEMSEELKSFVRRCDQHRLRYEAMAHSLTSKSVDPRYHGDVWRWLGKLQHGLGIPDILKPYFEQAALQSGKLARFASNLKELNSTAVGQWHLAATEELLLDLELGKLRLPTPEAVSLLVVEKVMWLNDKALRAMMAGFE